MVESAGVEQREVAGSTATRGRDHPSAPACRPHRLMSAVLLGLLAAACTSGTSTSLSGTPAPTSTTTSLPAPTAPVLTTSPLTSSASPPPPPAATGSSGVAAPPPQFLCQAAEQPRDTADAYTGALSSGQLAQATACVYPGTVPEATSQALLVTGTRGSAYTLNEAASSGSTFVYDSRRGRTTVTVSLEPDGHHWVTSVQMG